MATIAKFTKKQAGEWSPAEGESWSSFSARTDLLFKKLLSESAALPEGELVGAVAAFQYADGYAYYQVASTSPLKLRHIPVGDAWHIGEPTIRGLRLADVSLAVATLRRWRR